MAGAKNILIVEDEPSLADALEKAFRHCGFSVCVAKNGEDGLECMRTTRPDVVLLDVFMPVMNGIEMLERLRKEEKWKDVPVVMLSNANEPEKVTRCLEYGAFDFLVKSDWDMKDIVAKVQERLRA